MNRDSYPDISDLFHNSIGSPRSDVRVEGKGRSMQRPRKRLKFENVLMVVPLLFLACSECVQPHEWRLHKGREREKPVPGHHAFVVKQRKEMVTDLEKCCTPTDSIQPLHSQARRPLGHFHSWKELSLRLF